VLSKIPLLFHYFRNKEECWLCCSNTVSLQIALISINWGFGVLGFWGLYTFGRLGLAGAFFFAACGALRLARFNSINHLELPKSYFIGLPIPAAANLVAAAIIAQQELNIWYPESILLVLMFALGFLMVSTIRYRSFKDFDLRHKRSFFQLVLIVALIALIAIKPEITVAIVISYYVLWGPIREIFRVLKTKTEHKKENLHEINPPQ
jgi:CDP-diacylglycerol--serine O-phosphatidyltransferase